jgi:RNA polymerase sigma-70 factor (ECF subfamily)
MNETSDGHLVARVLAGERQAFGTLVERHQDRMLAYAKYMGFSEAHAQDLVQDAFVRSYRHLRRCGDPERFAGWLFRILSNLCRTAGSKLNKRSVHRLEELGDTLSSEEPTPDEAAEASWLRRKVREALDVVPEDQREALVLMYLQGYSVSEIEGLTGASASAVKMRLKRGREAMRAHLEPLFSEAIVDD